MAMSDKTRAKTEMILKSFIDNPLVEMGNNLQRVFNLVGNI